MASIEADSGCFVVLSGLDEAPVIDVDPDGATTIHYGDRAFSVGEVKGPLVTYSPDGRIRTFEERRCPAMMA